MIADDARAYHALATELGSNYAKLAERLRGQTSWTSVQKQEATQQKSDPDALWYALIQSGIRLSMQNDAQFPTLLREITSAPFGVYVRGEPIHDLEPSVAIVGTRAASPYAKRIAQQIARELTTRGITVVSGLALGIDAAAHRGALEAGGRTVAVLACGLDTVYPKNHGRLAESILEAGGSLVSEYPPGTAPLPHRFLERNRIISGLSLGTIVIEAPLRSGSLATARFAAEQNREVMVVPGQVDTARFAGAHALIREGAALVTNALDILDTLNLPRDSEKNTGASLAGLDELERLIVQTLTGTGTPLRVDAIATNMDRPISEINTALGSLMIKGMVRDDAGRYTIV